MNPSEPIQALHGSPSIPRTRPLRAHGAALRLGISCFDPFEALRRFAPATLAARIERGQTVVGEERMVSVLFADLRGYTAYASQRPPREVFALVSRFAHLVACVVGDHAGEIAEFAGDGIMAVFGAPEELSRKESAAVESGREICARVRQLPGEPASEHAPFSVGVGIATGEAFVGEVRAGGRAFWTAIGRVTNLASRLQQLTRELESAVVIDGRTWRAAASAAVGFEHRPLVPIKGHSDPEDVYVLRTGAA